MNYNKDEEEYYANQKLKIMHLPLKKNYKIWLDSHNTNSFTGPQFDARFFVDFNQCIREEWRLKSSYIMTFSFLSRASTFAVGTISTNNTYTIHIDLGQGTPTMYRYANARTPSGIVRVSTEGSGVYTTTVGVCDIPVYFNAKPNENEGVFINSLVGVNNININLIQAGVGTFNGANDATINTNTKYICCLNFQEV
jgi:hypothetical protein